MTGGILMTHMVASREQKPPFFFSRYNLQRIRERGNTHYCFHCGGHWGFTPGPNGEATNQMDNKITLQNRNGESVLIKDALKDVNLESHITDSPGYSRRKPEDKQYKQWLEYSADFDYTPEFVQWCEANGYAIHRYNPMEGHDPVAHVSGVVDGADKFAYARDWLEKKIGSDFPYIVEIT